jgi:phage terminase large subunit-like protein
MIRLKRSDLVRVVIGVDPAVTSTEDSDNTGIVVCGKGPHQPTTCVHPTCRAHGYVLEDGTLNKFKEKVSPLAWATRVVELFHKWDADLVVVEHQPAGELGRENIWNVEKIPCELRSVHDNKTLRAEPIAVLWDQGRMHMVGDPRNLLLLEEEMTGWVDGDPDSPDRLDAMVGAMTELKIRKLVGKAVGGINFEQSNPWAV